MTGVTCALTFVFGLLVGSFLNVVIYRVPRGESIVKPRSRCPHCGTEIRAYDNVPVVSWLVLRGRCRDCKAPISPRYPAVELFTGLIFLVMALKFGASWELPAYLYLAAIGVALSMIDFDVKRLPDVIVKPSYVVAGLLLLIPAVADSRWHDYLRAWLGALALLCFYGLIYLIAAMLYGGRGMGLGDVKLSGVLGLYLGWLGWGAVVVGSFLAFFYGAFIGIVLILVGRSGRKATVPFGPYMVLGAWTAILWGQTLWDGYLGTMN